ncbi:MAG: hypothetical protein HFI33_09120 [Lachnospiraceae bacterium]|nr:hypothetical protein [Lachnospiraceae bacterium]
MKQYTRKLLQHRANVVGRVLVCIFAIAAICFGVAQYHKNRSYESYEVISSMEHEDTINTRYEEYGDYLLKYSKDGITCLNLSHEAVWSQPFSIQDPIVSICGPSAVLADRGGNQVYIFNESGLLGQVDTLLPVQQVVVSRQGVTAVLLEDSRVSWIYLYDAEGNTLLSAQCSLADTGQPLSISLSHDGSKLAVSYLQISGGAANSCVVFYNLGSVGDNFVDKIVASRVYEGLLVSRVQYLDGDTCVAIGEEGFSIYEGAEIPEETETVLVEGEIRSICFGSKEVGVVCEQDGEEPYLLRVYDERGGLVLEQPFSLAYSQVKLSGDNVIVYNDTECIIYSKQGVIRYEGTFSESLVNVYSLQGRRFVLIHPQRTEVIKLK